MKKTDTKEKLKAVKDFFLKKKRMPTYSELMGIWHYASRGAVRYVLNQMFQDGVMEKDSSGRLMPPKFVNLHPILGEIKAGFPSPAEEELQDTISFDDLLITNPNSTYLVTVSGDSMIDAGIHPKDIVIVDRSRSAKNGDIVVAEVDNDWTMKYFQKIGTTVTLIAANSKYPPITPKESLNIGGVVTGVVRKY